MTEERDGGGSASPPVNLDDYAALAQARLPLDRWAWLAGAAGDELTLRANRADWDALRLVPRMLKRVADGSTAVQLLGRRCPHPIFLAPVAYQRLVDPLGELASAAAAAAQGAGFVLGTLSSVPLEEVAAVIRPEAERGPLWFQLYLSGDRGFDRQLIARAEAAGYEAIVLTIDAPVQGPRDRERRSGFRLPPDVVAVHRVGVPAPLPEPGAWCGGLMQSAPTWGDVEWLLCETRLPLLLKGVLHPDDAREAARLGVAGVIVSNHGGRILDGAISTAQALPPIADALQGDLALLVDGGIRRGTDILKALALGAQAVLVGRPYMMALAAAGPHGVAHAIRLLRDEFEIALALCGCASPAEVHRGLLHRGDYGR